MYYSYNTVQNPKIMLQKDKKPLAQDPYSYPQNLPSALKLIAEAVSGEREDEMFYSYLISIAPSDEDKNIISSIREDERKHNNMFRNIYYMLTGQMLPVSNSLEFNKPESYCDGIQKALFGELKAVEKYRKILFAMQNRRLINMLTEIITDEIKHSSKYNFLFAKNSCFEG